VEPDETFFPGLGHMLPSAWFPQTSNHLLPRAAGGEKYEG
jgi:hypothetical protein